MGGFAGVAFARRLRRMRRLARLSFHRDYDVSRLGQSYAAVLSIDTSEVLISELLSEKERQNIDNIQHLNSDFKDTFPFVSQHFRKFPRVKLVKGQVPDTLNDVEIEKVSFVSIDMNCVGPEIAAANFFWPKMVPGAFMLLDDYGFVSYEEQKSGFDAFVAERGTSVPAPPSGQGLIVKDAASAA
jgi:O-methyltransferase